MSRIGELTDDDSLADQCDQTPDAESRHMFSYPTGNPPHPRSLSRVGRGEPKLLERATQSHAPQDLPTFATKARLMVVARLARAGRFLSSSPEGIFKE